MRKLIHVLLVCSFLAISSISIRPSTVSTKIHVGDSFTQPLSKVIPPLYFQSVPYSHYSIVSVNSINLRFSGFTQEYLSLKKNDIKIPIYPRCNSPDS